MDVIESKSLDRDAGETRFPLFLIPLWTMIASEKSLIVSISLFCRMFHA
jgi:hypothetical protein